MHHGTKGETWGNYRKTKEHPDVFPACLIDMNEDLICHPVIQISWPIRNLKDNMYLHVIWLCSIGLKSSWSFLSLQKGSVLKKRRIITPSQSNSSVVNNQGTRSFLMKKKHFYHVQNSSYLQCKLWLNFLLSVPTL